MICFAPSALAAQARARIPAQQQQLVYRDSIVLVGNGADTSTVGYVFPWRVAKQFYELKTVVVPELDKLVNGLRAEIEERKRAEQARDSVITIRSMQVDSLRLALVKTDTIIQRREEQLAAALHSNRRLKTFLKFGLPVVLGLGSALGYGLK